MAHAFDAVLAERATRHGFADRPAADVRAAVRLSTAIQAQDAAAGRLGVRSRAARVLDTDVRDAIEARAVVRSWFMRSTIHLVDAADAHWLSDLLGPAIERRFRKRWLDIGLTPALRDRCERALPEILTAGPQTRQQIVAALAERGIELPAHDPQTPTHMLVSATVRGLLCRGHDIGRDATFVLVDRWLPGPADGPHGDDALAELARRYFAAFSPATAVDFATWSGLPATRAIGLIRDELAAIDVHGRPGFRFGEVDTRRSLRLLAGFDNYLIGYRHRDEMLPAPLRPRVYVGGIIKPTLLVDGRITGLWRLVRKPAKADVEITPFEPLTRKHRAGLEAEAEDLSRFLDQPVAVKIGTD
jgi:hypothetical protein